MDWLDVILGPKLLKTVINTTAMTTQSMRFLARSFKPDSSIYLLKWTLHQHQYDGASKAWL